MTSKGSVALEDAITSVAVAIKKEHQTLTRTKLVKLLYFLDLEAWQALGRKITDVEWVWHRYGPYSEQIVATYRSMTEEGELTEITTLSGLGGVQYKIEVADFGYYEQPPTEILELVRSVVTRLGGLSTSTLGQRSYDTAPMKSLRADGGVQGDVIEFPIVSPSAERVAATLDYHCQVLERLDPCTDGEDVASGLREDLATLNIARRSAGSKVL